MNAKRCRTTDHEARVSSWPTFAPAHPQVRHSVIFRLVHRRVPGGWRQERRGLRCEQHPRRRVF